MCFHRARASSEPLLGSVEEASVYGPETAVVTFAAEINGRADGVAVLPLRLVTLAGVAERSDPQDGPVPDVGEHGAVLKLSDCIGETMLESCSRDVSEIKMEGFSTGVSKEADL